MSIDSAEYRRIFGHWATGVAVVTAAGPDGAVGLTVNAVSSLSLNPPLALVCIDRASDSHDAIRTAGAYCINVLPEDGERIARRFAQNDATGRFDGIAWQPGRTDAPILDDALAWVECRIVNEVDAGDHTIFIGEVIAGDAGEGSPLLFYRGGYAGLAP